MLMNKNTGNWKSGFGDLSKARHICRRANKLTKQLIRVENCLGCNLNRKFKEKEKNAFLVYKRIIL